MPVIFNVVVPCKPVLPQSVEFSEVYNSSLFVNVIKSPSSVGPDELLISFNSVCS